MSCEELKICSEYMGLALGYPEYKPERLKQLIKLGLEFEQRKEGD